MSNLFLKRHKSNLQTTQLLASKLGYSSI